jgi:hypothetical protein
MLFKTSNQLFKGAYQYKIVLVCVGASLFRGRDMVQTLSLLKQVDLTKTKNTSYIRYNVSIKTQEDLDYALSLQKQLSKSTDYDIRVESPYISFYTNNKKDVDSLIKLDNSKVKYVCVPPSNTTLETGTIILPKIPFEYKVTLGKTTQNHSAFISWAESNSKVKVTKSCKKDLNRDHSWGGTYFYITGDNNLLLAKMHLGGSINKVERIIKA